MQSQIVCHGCRSVLLYPRGAPSVCCALCQAITTVPPPALEMAQLICGGCRTLLMYTRNADTVRCSCCSTVNLVRPDDDGAGERRRRGGASAARGSDGGPGERRRRGGATAARGSLGGAGEPRRRGGATATQGSLGGAGEPRRRGGATATRGNVGGAGDPRRRGGATAAWGSSRRPAASGGEARGEWRVNNIAHVNCGQCRTTLMYPYGAPSVKCAVCNYITNIGVNTVAPTPSPRPTSNGSSYNVPSTSAPTSQPQNVTVVVENPMTVDEKGKLVSNVVVGVTTGKK